MAKAIAVKSISAFGGIEILDIEYGVNDAVIWRTNYGTPGKTRRSRIYYTKNGRPYFKMNGHREYLDEYMRI